MKKYCRWLLPLLLVLFAVSCSNSFDTNKTSIQITLPSVASSSYFDRSIDSYIEDGMEFTLTVSGKKSKPVVINAVSGEKVTIEDILPGEYEITCKGEFKAEKDDLTTTANNKPEPYLYGKTSVTVEEGETSRAELQLEWITPEEQDDNGNTDIENPGNKDPDNNDTETKDNLEVIRIVNKSVTLKYSCNENYQMAFLGAKKVEKIENNYTSEDFAGLSAQTFMNYGEGWNNGEYTFKELEPGSYIIALWGIEDLLNQNVSNIVWISVYIEDDNISSSDVPEVSPVTLANKDYYVVSDDYYTSDFTVVYNGRELNPTEYEVSIKSFSFGPKVPVEVLVTETNEKIVGFIPVKIRYPSIELKLGSEANTNSKINVSQLSADKTLNAAVISETYTFYSTDNNPQGQLIGNVSTGFVWHKNIAGTENDIVIPDQSNSILSVNFDQTGTYEYYCTFNPDSDYSISYVSEYVVKDVVSSNKITFVVSPWEIKGVYDDSNKEVSGNLSAGKEYSVVLYNAAGIDTSVLPQLISRNDTAVTVLSPTTDASAKTVTVNFNTSENLEEITEVIFDIEVSGKKLNEKTGSLTVQIEPAP